MKTVAEKNALAAAAMPRVERIVHFMAKRLGPQADIDEIRSFALDGLAHAIENYDPAFKVPIDIFAAKRVEGQIIDGLSKNQMLPRRLQRQIAFIRKSQEMLQNEQQLPPPGDKVEAVHRLSDRLKDLAAVYITSCSTEDSPQIEAESTPEPEEAVARLEYFQQVKQAISKLPDSQQTLIQQYFYDDRTLEDIAAKFGKSRSWACRNLQTALRLIRQQFKETRVGSGFP